MKVFLRERCVTCLFSIRATTSPARDRCRQSGFSRTRVSSALGFSFLSEALAAEAVLLLFLLAFFFFFGDGSKTTKESFAP